MMEEEEEGTLGQEAEGEGDDTSVISEQGNSRFCKNYYLLCNYSFQCNYNSYYFISIFLEYAMLDKQLDDLNSVLDLLESKNDRIQAQLKALLENSREIRQSLAEERTTDENTPKTD